MSTSLSKQLQELRKPQSTLVLQDKKRSSLLFSPKDAANFDRETFFNIGLSGFEDLKKLSKAFQEFELNLFAPSSKGFERSMHNFHINQKINQTIERFLIILEPYFLLNCAHKALEWLIYRFHIHEFNKNEFFMLILPYHETRMFVRALQIIDLSDESDKWHWLQVLQKPGVPLSSITLVNRVASDNGLFKLMCIHVVNATSIVTEIYGSEPTSGSTLSSLYAFYTMAIIGAIERVPKMNEIQIGHILPTLAKGMSSPIIDFAISNCMILAQLSHKVQFNDDIMESLILKGLKNPHIRKQTMLLLNFFYESPNNHTFSTSVSKKLLSRVCKLSLTWLCDQLNKIQSLKIIVSRFVIPLFDSAILYVMNGDIDDDNEINTIKTMIKEILTNVVLQNNDVDLILNNILKQSNRMKIFSKASEDLFMEFYRVVELRYPESFDYYLKLLIKQSETNMGAKEGLHFLISCGRYGVKNVKGSLDILNGLNHYNVEKRIIALETFANNMKVLKSDISENYKIMLQQSLLDRLNDDDPTVVMTFLEKFEPKCLMSFYTLDILVDRMMILLSRCHTKERRILAQPALKFLLELYKIENLNLRKSSDTNIFLTTLPYLFPSCDEEIPVALFILQSDFAKRNRYLTAVKDDLKKYKGKLNTESIGLVSFHNILNYQLLPPTLDILRAMNTSYEDGSSGDATSLFFNLILLGSVCRVPVGSLDSTKALAVIKMASKIVKLYPKVKILPNCNHLNGSNIQDALQLTSNGILPLQATTYVLEMVHRRLNLQSNLILDFENNVEHAELIVRLLNILFDGMMSSKHRAHYSWCLKIFFQRHCSTSQDMLRFLAQFFIEPVEVQISFHCLKITLAILRTEYNNTSLFEWILNDEIFIVNLLIALSRPNRNNREAAVEILTVITSISIPNCEMNGCFCLLSMLKEKSMDILIDAEQLSIILYTLLSPDPDVRCQLEKKRRNKLEETHVFLMNFIINELMPIHTRAQLLQELIHVNGSEMIVQLINGIGENFLIKLNNNHIQPDEKKFTKMALKNILERFNNATVGVLKLNKVWNFFNAAISNNSIEILMKVGTEIMRLTPCLILLRSIDDEFFEKCRTFSNLQEKILAKLIDIVTYCADGVIVSAASKVMRKITFDTQLIINELRKMSDMKTIKSSASSSRKESNLQSERQHSEIVMINRPEWKRGITILEFIQRTEVITNNELLMKVLFDLLKMCLNECEAESSPTIEYTNQLILSTIHRLAAGKSPIPDAHEQVELISQCIRISHNPQTHHHALLVLVELFKVAHVDVALHNVMPIFTFMGNSVLRQDDAYSIQIISKIIETVIPTILVKNNEFQICTILRIFIVSLPDIPEHRRLPLFVKLLEIMKQNLFLFYLIMFECQVKIIQRGHLEENGLSLQRCFEFALTLSQEFSPDILIQASVKLIEFLRDLPQEIDDNSKGECSFSKTHIFDVSNSTSKQLRHYKYTIVQFLSLLISCSEVVNRVTTLNEQETNDIVPHYNALLVQLIMMIDSASRSADIHQGKPKGKYWKVLVHNLYNILDAVNGLLPNAVFVQSIQNLINSNQLVIMIRRKALELMNVRLQQRKFTGKDRDNLLGLIDPLLAIVSNEIQNSEESLNQEMEMIQQTAVITLKLLAKSWANEYPTTFLPVLAGFTAKLGELESKPLLGSIILGIAELCGIMRTYAIRYINKFMPVIIKLLSNQCNNSETKLSLSAFSSVFIISIMTALQKIVESMGHFLSLYLDQLIFELCRLHYVFNMRNSVGNHKGNPAKIDLVIARIQVTSGKLSSCIPIRLLIPAVEKTYNRVMEMQLYHCIGPLMGILSEAFNRMIGCDVKLILSDIIQLFLHLLQFREQAMTKLSKSNPDFINNKKIITEIEDYVGEAIVSLVLKLNEATFRPFYYKLYDWTVRNDKTCKERNITFFRLSNKFAECLKSLFVLFAGHFLTHATLLLFHNTQNVNEKDVDMEQRKEYRLDNKSDQIDLINAILMTFYKIFNYDAHCFVDKKRFEILIGPIIDQIENSLGTKEDYETRTRELTVPCIGAFVSAIQDDSLHKQVVYQILLKTKHAQPHIRRAGLEAILEIARKLAKDFMPLLSETIPFLAEMLEDEDKNTEEVAQNAVRILEEILEEPLQRYF